MTMPVASAAVATLLIGIYSGLLDVFLKDESSKRHPDQVLARIMRDLVDWHNRQTDVPLTNMVQLRRLAGDHPGLIELEGAMKKRPAKARGFQTSILQKYVVINSSVHVPDRSWVLGGKIRLIEAGELGTREYRYVIWQHPNAANCELASFSEKEIIDWFHESDATIPPPQAGIAPIQSQQHISQQREYDREIEETFNYFYDQHRYGFFFRYSVEILAGLTVAAFFFRVFVWRRQLRRR